MKKRPMNHKWEYMDVKRPFLMTLMYLPLVRLVEQSPAEGDEQNLRVILNEAVSVGVGIVSPERIDEINILNATYEAMREAINNLTVKPDILLNDAVTIPGVDIEQVPIIKGDAKSLSIASASIIAKVTRDRLMYHYDELYPEYGFAKHKGYGTKLHTDVLKEIGPCPIHRKTFITKICP